MRRVAYRDSSCKRYAAMLERKNVMMFETAAEAEAAGYHKASDCPRDREQQ
jgi:methylphosphotriester-DNA--protein-cysteine methyltransferase